ncbi:hypothetical protein [Kaistella palustris]|uniref:hypothetical protein n=1 Tax=Kaistella palustris TaxID=493376 RepID=UPI0012EC291E|nr:hypothetical protein [Kaistella palustris]
MKTQIYSVCLILALSFPVKSQVLITSNSSGLTTPDASAVLQVQDANRGILLPRVPLSGPADNNTILTPVQGLIVYNTTQGQLNFRDSSQWNKVFETADGLALIKATENFSGASTVSNTITTFPSTMPLFNLDDSPTGWTNLGSASTINVTKAVNTNYIIAEGMAQINNDTATNQEFQFAIGVFVDGKLKIARKYTAVGKNFVCNWKKFSLSGVFDNLSVGSHTVSIYGRNLPKLTTGYSSITYGGNTSNCSNINNDMARIFITAQLTQ